MSIMACTDCGRFVDTDDDPDSLYVVADQCVCESCRGDRNPDYELYDKQRERSERIRKRLRDSGLY